MLKDLFAISKELFKLTHTLFKYLHKGGMEVNFCLYERCLRLTETHVITEEN